MGFNSDQGSWVSDQRLGSAVGPEKFWWVMNDTQLEQTYEGIEFKHIGEIWESDLQKPRFRKRVKNVFKHGNPVLIGIGGSDDLNLYLSWHSDLPFHIHMDPWLDAEPMDGIGSWNFLYHQKQSLLLFGGYIVLKKVYSIIINI